MYQERISRVLAAMERMGLEQMLVSDPDSIWYLTGYDVFPFERLYAFYLRKDGQHKLFLNKLFPVPEAPYEQVWFSDTDDYLAILANAVDGEKDMGVDKDWPARFLLPLMAHNPSCKYVLASDCVDDARACKDAVEQDLMREASRINDVVMERAAAYMKEGMTEREVSDYIAAQYAAEHGFQWFTTTLSISPHKDAARINAIGQELEAEFGVKHLPSDFKKHNGYLRSLQLSEQYGLYRQDYCGCEFSAKARGIEG